jgi:hypothetical protein
VLDERQESATTSVLIVFHPHFSLKDEELTLIRHSPNCDTNTSRHVLADIHDIRIIRRRSTSNIELSNGNLGDTSTGKRSECSRNPSSLTSTKMSLRSNTVNGNSLRLQLLDKSNQPIDLRVGGIEVVVVDI